MSEHTFVDYTVAPGQRQQRPATAAATSGGWANSR
jgi:hypothetical protein